MTNKGFTLSPTPLKEIAENLKPGITKAIEEWFSILGYNYKDIDEMTENFKKHKIPKGVTRFSPLNKEIILEWTGKKFIKFKYCKDEGYNG